MPFCPSCGNNVAPDFAFCPRCGAKLPLDANVNGYERAKLRIESHKTAGIFANYEGSVKDGIPEGRGTAHYDNGDTYNGEWKKGVKHGQGVYTWPDGRKYEGQFREDYFCGQGIMCFPDGNRYEGEFAKDQMNGHGIMIFKNADRCVGEWESGNPAGHYRYYFSNGYFLDGESIRFMGDDPVFRGVVRDNNGKIYYYTGMWCSDIRPRDCWSFVKQNDNQIYYNGRPELPVKIVMKWSNGFYVQEKVEAFLNPRYARERSERMKESCWSSDHVVIKECRLPTYFTPPKLYMVVRSSRKDNVEPLIIGDSIYGTRDDAANRCKQKSGIDLSCQDQEYDCNHDCYWQIIKVDIKDFPEM